jgi:uncharacterized protein (TIGR02145 family)
MKGGGRGICPMGWHVPTDLEWSQMLDAIEGIPTFTTSSTYETPLGVVVGRMLKTANTYTAVDTGIGAWIDDNSAGEDKYGFSVMPAGAVNPVVGDLRRRGHNAYMASSSTYGYRQGLLIRFARGSYSAMRQREYRVSARSVRCIID